MKLNLPQHPCTNKCTEFKNEPCNHCLIMANLPELESTKSDFLVGDVVCITEAWRPNTNNLYVFENVIGDTAQVSLFLSGISKTMAIAAGFCVSVKNIRHATVAELHANRRLTEAEHALAEVS